MSNTVTIGEHGMWRPDIGLLWAAEGRVSLGTAETEDEASEKLARYDAGEFWCSGCKEWHGVDEPVAWSWFAGRYCEASAERVKAANSRVCGLCRRPMWDCYC